MADFFSQVSDWVEDVKEALDEGLSEIVFLVGESVVTLSPVKTGRFRGNWQLTINGLSTNSLIRYDKSGGETLKEIRDKSQSFTYGEIAYIQNNILYGPLLEDGSATRAPNGMVAITEDRFVSIVNDVMRRRSGGL